MPCSSMKAQSALICLLLLSRSQAFAQATFNWTSIPASSNLSWVECYSSPMQCTRLTVPLNYSSPNAGSVTLALARIPSPLNGTSSYRGPILINPGGPGGSGVEALSVQNSVPLISFFETDVERAAFDLGPDATDATATPNVLSSQWAHFQVMGHLAQDRDDGFLAHVTTDNVARDMLHIVEAHGQTQFGYWGVSYGTVLGATFASMFPDKVERLVIDGVLDMEGYYSTNWANQSLDTEKVLQEFFQGCFKAGPQACAFYDTSPAAISRNLVALYSKVIAQPAVAYSPSLPEYGIVDHAVLKSAIFNSLYIPYSSFSPLAQGLAALRKGNGSLLYQLSSALASEALAAIACGDGEKVTDNSATLEKYAETISNLSSFSDVVVSIRTLCSGWRIHPNNFKGSIEGSTSFPLLLIGNTADPATPLAGAKKTSKGFPGSVVLTQDSPGHTSFSIPSECTLGYVKQYFQNGTLPPAGTVCPVVGDLFPVASNVSAREEIQSRSPLRDVAEALTGIWPENAS
ncbi:TAP-like protein-domain-containing protein [Flammula alnicola]|nr:TAP-like protein-domain-containing protein [Flammula alnicola]